VIFEDLPDRGAFKIKTGAQVMFVKMICQWTRIFQRKMGVIKSLSSQEILVHFPEEDKTIEVENTNGRIFDIKSILQQRK
jgi:hypothetical protein